MLLERSSHNPVLKPNIQQSWESDAVFNGCPVQKGKATYLVYRAVSLPHYHSIANTQLKISDIGVAKSMDGIHFSDRKRFIVPDKSWDRFGCEDPRVTRLNGKYYIFYTALSEYPFRAEGIKVGVAISKNMERVQEKHPVTPFNAKAMALFPQKIGGKFWVILTANTDKPPSKICVASFSREEDMWSEKKWNEWYKDLDKNTLPLQRTPNDQIEIGAQPIKTPKGWVVLYSYIRNYGNPKQVFTIEAVLLDLKNPKKIIGSTKAPLMIPKEYYEKIGHVPNIVFPSGAIVKKGIIHLYYGAADTTCCLAMVSSKKLIEKLLQAKMSHKSLWSNEKLILSPKKENVWEEKATFNPAAIRIKGRVHLLYRAMSNYNTSVIGYASSNNGININYRSVIPAYIPREGFERKTHPDGNSGCEDPRITQIGNRIYMCYTAFDGSSPPRVALSSIAVKDFLKQKWEWTKPVLISPPNIDDKDACIFPEKIGGKFYIIHRSGDDIDLSINDDLNFDGSYWLEEHRLIAPRQGMWDSRKVGIASPPIKLKEGWLLLYHGISEDGIYRVGVALADLKNPMHITARSTEPIFEPRKDFQKIGQVSNVVFPCGSVVIENKLFMYYGAADSVIGVATIPVKTLIKLAKD